MTNEFNTFVLICWSAGNFIIFSLVMGFFYFTLGIIYASAMGAIMFMWFIGQMIIARPDFKRLTK